MKNNLNDELGEQFDFLQAQIKTWANFNKPPPSPVLWIEKNFIDPVTKERVKLEPHQKRIIRRALSLLPDGRSRYNLVVWSEPKKSGKTTVAAAAGAYVADNIEAPNEVCTVANDQEQSAGRIFANMMDTLTEAGWKTPVNRGTSAASKAIIDDPRAYGHNGTSIRAITTRYEKEAGANQGLSLWSELWAYKGERLTRLWEEMTPPPTRKFSMRWVETYAGFIGENLLLQSIYQRVFDDFSDNPNLMPGVKQLWPDLPVYELDNGRTLVYWSHTPRMPWQTPEYYESQRIDLRPSAYKRLHENRWVESSSSFISHAMWLNSIKVTPKPQAATYALDGSKNGDCTALVGCVKKDDVNIHTTDVHVWELDGKTEVDYADIERTVVDLWKSGKLVPPLWYDPYQLAYLAQRLRDNHHIPCKEFSQGQERVRADTFLYKLYNEGHMHNVNHPKLRQHIIAASAKEYADNKVRIIKPEEGSGSDMAANMEQLVNALTKKVDLAVAQSMAAYKAHIKKLGGWGASGDEPVGDVPATVQASVATTLPGAIKAAVERGEPINCRPQDYIKTRTYLHKLSGFYIEVGQDAKAYICLAEVQRLDKFYG